MALKETPRAVITGAGSGLGRALALALAQRKAKLILADLNLPGAEETLRLAIEAGATEARAVSADVSKLEDVERLAELAEAQLGGTDLLINNAGVAVSGLVGEVPIADWQWIVGVNLWGVIHGCHVFLPKMKLARSGHVLNVASAAGLVSSPAMAPYNATKAAVVALSETLAGELAGSGVGVTVLCPTFFRTNIIHNARSQTQSLDKLALKLMDRSKIQAEQVAALALDGVQRDALYVVPMADGRWMWRLKRLMPATFYRTLLKRGARVASRIADKTK